MKKTILTSLYVILLTNFCFSQCPQFYDYNGNLSSLPEWIVCDGSDFSLNLQSDVNIGNYSIDWGDGSAQSSGNSWLANNAIIHTYNQSVATYTLTINLTDIPCTVTGEITMEEPTNASIQIPFGGITSTCAPGDIDFINSSTDVSENTTFTWNFSDGTPNETFDFNNVGQLVSHLYESGTVSCATQVTLTAENKCNTLQGGASLATFTPIRIWDIDNASISASSTLLCYPDVSVSFQNTSDRNCHAQGNVNQRYEYWNLGDYWGLGYDSIIDWRPWPPALNIDVDFPGVGNYEIMLIDSSFCGLDSATVYVNIVNSPMAGLSADDDSICVGESVLFHNLSTGFTSNYIWDFGDGSSWTQIWGGDILRTFFTPGTFEVLLIPQISGACRDTARVNIFVSDVPNANFSFDNNDGCDSLNVQISNISSTDITQWDWDFGNGNTDNSSIPPLQHYDTSGLYTVSLNVSNTSGCTNSFSDQINVYERPISNFEPINVCVNQLSQFNDLSLSQANDAIINWSWEFSSIDSSNLQNPTYAFTNAGIHEVILEVSTAHCKDSDTIDVFVESLPTANYSTDTSIGCSPLNITFINSSSNNSINYDWDFGDNSSSNIENTMHEFINTSSNDTTYNSLLIVSTLAGCKDSISKPITVLSNPTASFTNNAVLDCAPLNVDFTNTSSNASNYVWDLGDGSDTDTNTHINHSFDNLNLLIETFDVELIAFNTNGCKDTTTNKIIVYPQPQFDFSTIPATGCSPLEVNFPSSNGAVAYNWDFGDGNSSFISTPTHTYNNNTNTNLTFNVKLLATSPFGCMDSSFQQIEVFPNPTANFITSEDTACSPLNTTITNISTNANDYQWYMGDGTTTTNSNPNFDYTFNNAESYIQNYDIKLVVENTFNCKDSIIKEVVVNPIVNADFTVDTLGCTPLNVNFINNSLGGITYQWDFDDGTNSTTPLNQNHQYVNNQNNAVSFFPTLILESSLGCKDSIQQEISVLPVPNAQFYVSEDTACSPLNTIITNVSTNANDYQWYMGDGTINTNSNPNFDYTFNNAESYIQNYDIKLVVENTFNCKDSIVKEVVVNPIVNADFTVDTLGCTPLSVNFINNSFGGITYQWDFDDGTTSSSSLNQNHQYVNNQNNAVSFFPTLILESGLGCRDSIQKEIIVSPTPSANFTSSDNSGCHPLILNLINTSTGSQDFVWNLGDGNIISDSLNISSYQYINSTTLPHNYTIKLIAKNSYNCMDSISENIVVYPQVEADFVSDSIGCSPLEINFYNLSIGEEYYWDFDDGTTSNSSNNEMHTYSNSSNSQLSFFPNLKVENQYGCKDSIQQEVIVLPVPNAQFSVSENNGCHPFEISINNTSTDGENYIFDMGNGNTISSTLQTLNYSYQNTTQDVQNYTISLLASSLNQLCTDTFTTAVSVYPKVFSKYVSDSAGCSPLNAQFYNLSTNADNYEWDFGNGQNSNTALTASQQYINNSSQTISFNTSLISSSNYGCSDTSYQVIYVYPTPLVDFSVSPISQTLPNSTVEITNNSSVGNWNYQWGFGDNNQSQLENPSPHNYTSSGEYGIQLIMSNIHSCSDSAIHWIEILPAMPVADFDVEASGCIPLKVNFESLSLNASTYSWDFGDGTFSSQENPTKIYYEDGIYSVSLTVFNGMNSDSKVQVNVIEVFKTPISQFTISTDYLEEVEVALVTNNQSTFADNYLWDFGDSSNSVEFSPSHLYENNGVYTITLIAYNDECSDTSMKNISVANGDGGHVLVPNTFTPNSNVTDGNYRESDGINDIFHPVIIGAKSYKFDIYNRWGEHIFHTNDLSIGWNGFFRGQLCQQDVYIYKIHIVYNNNSEDQIVGRFTLVR